MSHTSNPTADRLLHAVAAASDRTTAVAVVERFDLGGPLAAEALGGALLQSVGARTTDADSAVVVTAGEVTWQAPVVDGVLTPARDTAQEEELLAVLDGDAPVRVTASRLGGDGVAHETLAWDLAHGWLWPAHTDLDGAHPGTDLWRVELDAQQDEQRRTDRALAAGAAIIRGILGAAPLGASTLRVVDAGEDRTYDIERDAAGAHVPVSPAGLQAEAALIGGPVAFGSGAVTLILHSGDEHDGGAELRGWRVQGDGVVALDAHALKSALRPSIFDRHKGLTYVDAYEVSAG